MQVEQSMYQPSYAITADHESKHCWMKAGRREEDEDDIDVGDRGAADLLCSIILPLLVRYLLLRSLSESVRRMASATDNMETDTATRRLRAAHNKEGTEMRTKAKTWMTRHNNARAWIYANAVEPVTRGGVE